MSAKIRTLRQRLIDCIDITEFNNITDSTEDLVDDLLGHIEEWFIEICRK